MHSPLRRSEEDVKILSQHLSHFPALLPDVSRPVMEGMAARSQLETLPKGGFSRTISWGEGGLGLVLGTLFHSFCLLSRGPQLVVCAYEISESDEYNESRDTDYTRLYCSLYGDCWVKRRYNYMWHLRFQNFKGFQNISTSVRDFMVVVDPSLFMLFSSAHRFHPLFFT